MIQVSFSHRTISLLMIYQFVSNEPVDLVSTRQYCLLNFLTYSIPHFHEKWGLYAQPIQQMFNLSSFPWNKMLILMAWGQTMFSNLTLFQNVND